MLALDGVGAHYGAATVALNGVSLTVRSGSAVALLGSNGAGKSTTLRAISGVLVGHGGRQTSGSIHYDGLPLDGVPADRRVRMGIVQVPEGRQIFTSLSVEENLRIGRYGKRADRSGTHADLERAFDMFPILGERRHQAGGLLSGGEQQMLAIARALMASPRLLVLDEPSLGLAPKIVDQIAGIVRRINEGGTSVLIVEQNAHVALELTEYAYVLAGGKVVVEGASADLKRSEDVQRAYLGGDLVPTGEQVRGAG
ncbi:ABC transporter ATP-binding protein [Streptomyces sp. SHP 1-2]|nr:ABC transporter ATP-binding protein [Streptomyces sp. SHP 1-2]MYU24077.1 ATP-binding cassette domain-containing protein [Streptomyces sp. SID8352]